MKGNAMNEAYSSHESDKKCVQSFGWESWNIIQDTRCKWKDNIKVYPKALSVVVDSIHLAQFIVKWRVF
jgi:hypothetical protein